MPFFKEGFQVIHDLLVPQEVAFARMLVTELIRRYRADEAAVRCRAISVAEVTCQHPERNLGVQANGWESEPFIIGDLVALDPRFSVIFAKDKLWRCAAQLLACPLNEVVFHMSNLTRKPSGVGPAIGRHRDAGNAYFSATDDRTIRMLFPLQAMSDANGGTVVWPGSHLPAVHGSALDPLGAICPAVAPGSALALHAKVLHGGAPNRSQVERDVIVLQFGVRSSPLLHQAHELLSMYSCEKVLEFSASL